jgi:hypothetical protein
MSLTGAVPKIFSTSPRRHLMKEIPEKPVQRHKFGKEAEELDPDSGKIKPVPCIKGTWHGLLDRIHRTIPVSGTNVRGMTPGMPKGMPNRMV